MAIKYSGGCGQSYLEGLKLHLATLQRPIVSNTSQLCYNDDVTLHTNIENLSIFQIFDDFYWCEKHNFLTYLYKLQMQLFLIAESNLCDVMTTSLCKLPCTQQNRLFPATQIHRTFM